MNSKSLQTGFLLKGNSYTYKIERVLGQGSFGITYLASVKMEGALGSIDVNIKVAIKEFFMRDINGRSDATVTSGSKGGIYDDYRRKFAREALNLSKLQHPNIIKVIESFEANNTVYYVMEYISGGSLDEYIAKKNGLKEGEAIRMIKQIGSALSFMHSQRMLHLDLKPSNIMLRDSGDVVLIDFGLSKQYNENGEPESSTKVGAGTPGYAPIEQANYREGKGFPVTMDVYALGGTMYKMLTATRPPDASEILNDGFPIKELKDHHIDSNISAAIVKTMEPIKKRRYQTVDEFLTVINSFTPAVDTFPPVIQKLIDNMVNIEGGIFMIGNSDLDAPANEKPTHKVSLSSYAIGRYPVTQEEWIAIMDDNPSFFKNERRPVENVSWYDCQTFISKLYSLTGKMFRLPTEAEWEFAARGGNRCKRFLYAGSNAINDVAVYEKSGSTQKDSPYFGTQNVGTKHPNELGLYDMSGNVSEWCYDWYGNYASTSKSSPIGPSHGCFRIHRGGGWNSISRNCTVSARDYDLPTHKYSNIGFRLVIGPILIDKPTFSNNVHIDKALLPFVKKDKAESDVEVIDAQKVNEPEVLYMPDALHISVQYGLDGYCFTFDIASDHLHTYVSASPLKVYLKGTILDDEYFINYSAFKERFKRLGFLDKKHWEKSISETLTGKETSVYVDYSWKGKDYKYSRSEKSFNGILVQAVEKLLEKEDVLQRVIKLVKQNI